MRERGGREREREEEEEMTMRLVVNTFFLPSFFPSFLSSPAGATNRHGN
jgi:hypothetical protein